MAATITAPAATATATAVIILSLVHIAAALSQDGLYLLQIKQAWSEPDAVLAGWSDHDDDPCRWHGVACNPAGAVVSLTLTSLNLYGPFPSPSLLCSIPSLATLSLADNFINGSLPDDADGLAGCRSLTHLDLSQNILVGTIPAALVRLSSLTYLDLSGNNFTGDVPPEFGGFRQLEVISLVANLLNGAVPAFLANVSTLRQLNLSYNPFVAGEVPAEFGRLQRLEVLWMAGCNLVGHIPASLGNLQHLIDLDFASNNLAGEIPEAIMSLESVVQIELYNNSLSGQLPSGWSKLTKLKRFDASMNHLEGEIPAELCSLALESLNLYENRLVGGIPDAISLSPDLYELRLFGNRLSGHLPAELGKNSPLRWVDLSTNNFSGEIPAGICGKGELEELLLIENQLEGPLPAELGQCRSLVRVRLLRNRLSGEVPAVIWALPHVWLLELSNNNFSGKISPAIAGASNLSILLLDNNHFAGAIPPEIGSAEKLEGFSARMNQLSGSIPTSMGRFPDLATLDLHGNKLSGDIPSTIASCAKLTNLDLAGNQISGVIPRGIGSLQVLIYLDLSHNELTGEVPTSLQNLKLNLFNLSNNRLSGKLPPLYANENYEDSFLGNPDLCSELPGLCSASGHDNNRVRRLPWLLKSIYITSGLILVAGLVLFLRFHNFKKKQKSNADKLKWSLTSFHKLGFNKDEIIEALDEDNVIGRGASGKVYKVLLGNGETVAVKKLWGGSKEGQEEVGHKVPDDGFEAEVQTLGKIRHKNIVKLWCACTTRDCKLLVYEYMANGSLGDLVHGAKGGLLDWQTRYKIVLDAAEGLSYLHHDCAPPIVHRDVKSNNILLDADYGAKVADFGVAKMVDSIGRRAKSMSTIAGSCGYIAPEYAYTLRVNEKSDIYSFGVVILELLTGRLPVDPEYGEKDLVKWVCYTLEQKGVDHVIDTRLHISNKEEICKVLNIGLLCTSPLPVNRPSMRRVVKMLVEAGPCTASKQKLAEKDEVLTPYCYENTSDLDSIV